MDAYLEQNGARYPVYAESHSSTWILWNRHQRPRALSFEACKSQASNLKDRKARLLIEAVSNDLRANITANATDVDVVLEAPRVVADEFPHYVNQGGMELVTMTASGWLKDAGVKVGTYTFRSFPLPGKNVSRRFAMFAYPLGHPQRLEPCAW